MLLDYGKITTKKAAIIIAIAAFALLLMTAPAFAEGEVLPESTPEAETPAAQTDLTGEPAATPVVVETEVSGEAAGVESAENDIVGAETETEPLAAPES